MSEGFYVHAIEINGVKWKYLPLCSAEERSYRFGMTWHHEKHNGRNWYTVNIVSDAIMSAENEKWNPPTIT